MTVADLIAQLRMLPPDAVVVLAKDGEGNDFSPLYAAERRMYLARNTWSGELLDPDETDAVGVPAAVLWPTN